MIAKSGRDETTTDDIKETVENGEFNKIEQLFIDHGYFKPIKGGGVLPTAKGWRIERLADRHKTTKRKKNKKSKRKNRK